MKLCIAPDFKAAVPAFLDHERADLLEMMKASPKTIPPVLYWSNGPKKGGAIVVDGMTRYIEASKHAIKLKFVGVEFGDREDAINFTRGVALARRNLTPSQRAQLYAEYNQHKRHGGDRRSDEAQAAADQDEEVNLDRPSSPLLAAANKVIAGGSVKLNAAVRNGDVSAQDAASILHLSKADQDKALAKVLAGNAATLRAAVPKKRTRKKAGSPVIDRKQRAALQKTLNALVRALDSVKLVEEFRECTNKMYARFKTL